MTKEYDINNLTINQILEIETKITKLEYILQDIIRNIFATKRSLMCYSGYVGNFDESRKEEVKILNKNVIEKLYYLESNLSYADLDQQLQFIKHDMKKLDDKKLEVDEYIKAEKAKIAQTIQTLKEKEDLLNNKLSESILTTKGE